ncbi:MAG: hypothetical protein K6E64_00115 [Lachnospiraceae bacterium]|nr:hypothetical protein [Lachnospiraceae bacterium]
MKILKSHWPIILMLAAFVYCIYEWLVGASEDTGGVIAFYIVGFGIILPLCSLILSAWYGYRLRSGKKWLIAIACVTPCIIMTIICGDYKFWENWGMELLSVIAGCVGMLIGSSIWKIKNKEDC